MAEVDGISEHISALARLALDEVPLPDLLFRVAQLATRLVARCDMASITTVTDDGPATVALAGLVLTTLDDAQYDAGDGPCLTAHRTGDPVRYDDGDPIRWPAFESAAKGSGVKTSLSIPLVTGDDRFGSLNMYSTSRRAFDDRAHALSTALAEQASATVHNAQLYWTTRALVDQLQEALSSRAMIDQAKGIVMARHLLNADAAFDILRVQSQRENRKLRDIAQALVDEVSESK